MRSNSSEIVVTDLNEIVKARGMEVLARIPDAGDDGSSILANLLVDNVADLIEKTAKVFDKEQLPPIESYYRQPLRITNMWKIESDYDKTEAVFPYFLVLEFVTADGEVIRASTGSATVIVVCGQLYAAGVLPATVVMDERQTKGGNTVVNVRVMSISELVSA